VALTCKQRLSTLQLQFKAEHLSFARAPGIATPAIHAGATLPSWCGPDVAGQPEELFERLVDESNAFVAIEQQHASTCC